MELWTDNLDAWKRGPFYYAHLADALRLVFLYQHGGVYFDTDVIFVAPVTHLRNAVGLEDEGAREQQKICNAVMIFDKGNTFLEQCMEMFSLAYNPNVWDQNGPVLLTGIWRRFYSDLHITPSSGTTQDSDPRELMVLSRPTFYPINWRNVTDFFQPSRANIVTRNLNLIRENSLTVHFWNKMTRSVPVSEGSLMQRLFAEFCLLCDVPVI